MSIKTDKHIECISDFCGNYKSPGAWADIFERADGTRYIGLGGGWEFYCDYPPKIIHQDSPHYAPFIEACNKWEDFGYAKKHWNNPN